MTDCRDHPRAPDRPPSGDRAAVRDLCLMLRAHAEASWLRQEVEPVLRQIERDGSLSGEQLSAALAYLEVLWLEACGRAAETEATCTAADDGLATGERQAGRSEMTLHGRARRYHSAVRRLRSTLANRVSGLVPAPNDVVVGD